jgi:hypothetical protein
MVATWRSSGLSMSEFSRRHALDPKRLARWVAKAVPATTRPAFVEVTVSDREEKPSEPIEVLCPTGHVIRIPEFAARTTLALVLEVLARTAC